jgi:hypothetical protein
MEIRANDKNHWRASIPCQCRRNGGIAKLIRIMHSAFAVEFGMRRVKKKSKCYCASEFFGSKKNLGRKYFIFFDKSNNNKLSETKKRKRK